MDQKYWLAENGEVRCLDDRCPQECDMRCPIYLQTLAVEAYQSADYGKAAQYFAKAVQIEPTFAEAWNNLAACYGILNNHQGAYEAYLKAFDLRPKPNTLYGIAVAARHMGNYSLAKQYVMMYKSRYGSNDRIEALMTAIEEDKMAAQIQPSQSSTAQPESRTSSEPRQTSEKPENNYSDQLIREYGSIYLMLLDPAKRQKGYAELEKIESRFPEAGIALGQYYYGKGDTVKAKVHFKAAADAGIAEGQWSYAQLMPHSFVLDFSNPGDQEYLRYCQAAAEAGNPDAANEMGNICHRKGFYEESTYWYGMANTLGHPSGNTSLRGIVKEWQQKGIQQEFRPHLQNFTEDRCATARLLYKAYTQSLDVGDLDQLMTLALAGENLAGFVLASVIEQRHADDIVYTIYNALAFEHHPFALCRYADLLHEGKGTDKDEGSAVRMYRMSAQGGNAMAILAMGKHAASSRDRSLAAGWLGMAYSRGIEEAGSWLMKLQ